MRWIVLLLVFLAGAGVYRGWLSFSAPSRDSLSGRLDVTVSVDTVKLQSDLTEVKSRVDSVIAGQKKPAETVATGTAWTR